MTTDRDEALRRAETLLRQGQVDAAILESAHLAEAHPTDWALLNALGDLFVRAGASQRAVALYSKVADAYLTEGFYAKAAGFFKKVLKFTPGDEDILMKLAAACAHQGLRADARTYLQAVAAGRQRRRDTAGLAAVLCRLDDLDAADFAGRLAAIRALVPLEPVQGLARLCKVAEELDARQRGAEALAVWQEILKLDSSHRGARRRVAAAALATGDPRRALDLLGSAAALEDQEEFDLLIEAQWQVAGPDEVRRSLLNLLRRHPGARHRLAAPAARVFGPEPDSAFQWVDAWTQAALAERDALDALRSLDAFVATFPQHVDALTRVVAIAGEQGLEDRVTAAQSALLEAYLASGDHQRASATAEALAARHPGDERYRELLMDMLESPAAPGAEGAAPDDTMVPVAVEPILDPDVVALHPLQEDLDVEIVELADLPEDLPVEADPTPDDDAIAIEDVEEPELPFGVRVIDMEVDLTERLDLAASEGEELPGVQPGPTAAAPADASGRSKDLDATFAAMRSEAVAQGGDLLALGRTYLGAGLDDQAIEAFVAAAHDEAQRYDAAVALVEVFDAKRDGASLVEWLEQAAESAPSTAKRGAALYRLGVLLEQLGEPARALAVLLELKAMVPAFRDVSARVARLEAGQSGGGSSTP